MIIKGVEFHDLYLTGIDFALRTNEIILSCDRYDEGLKGYSPIKVYFTQVKNIVLVQMEIDNLYDAEIASMDLDESKEIKTAKILMLLGRSALESALSFEYESLHYSW